jgi:hypothetical protein
MARNVNALAAPVTIVPTALAFNGEREERMYDCTDQPGSDPATRVLTELALPRPERHTAVRWLLSVCGTASAIGVMLAFGYGTVNGFTPALGRITAALGALLGASVMVPIYRLKRRLQHAAVVMFLLTMSLWILVAAPIAAQASRAPLGLHVIPQDDKSVHLCNCKIVGFFREKLALCLGAQ